jgi:multidrug efflux system membrane fusion protein
VPEQRVAQFRPGRAVAVEVWAAPGKRLPGEVREIAPAADPLTRTYAARIRFDGVAAQAEVGQSARVWAQDPTGATLAVPLSAVVEHDGAPVVFVVRDAAGDARHVATVVRRTPVRIGPYGEDSVPVLSGLQPDDWVVAAGAHLLRDGQAVRPVDRHDRAVAIAPVRAAVAVAAAH